MSGEGISNATEGVQQPIPKKITRPGFNAVVVNPKQVKSICIHFYIILLNSNFRRETLYFKASEMYLGNMET